MELSELVCDINDRLKAHYGIDSLGGGVIWRIVWSDDQLEKRLGTYHDIAPSGIYLRTVTEVREVPKYRQWIHQRWVLERLVVVPEQNQEELPTAKISYEPIWTFEDKDGNYLPPKWEAAKFIIDTIYAAQYGPKNHSMKKYVDEESSQEASEALKKKRIDEIEAALWGEDSAHRAGIQAGSTIHLTDGKK